MESDRRIAPPSQWQVVVTGPRGGFVTARYFTDKAKAKDFFTTCLAKYLDYNVEFEKCEQ